MEIKPCPFCGGEMSFMICDDEGNLRDEEYEKNPWSGVSYKIQHTYESNEGCPIAVYDEDDVGIGVYLYDTKEDVINAWNRRI